MLKIRLRRGGKKHQPYYRIVIAEHTSPVKGKYRDLIGNYNPRTKKIVLNKEKALEWMNKGAKPSNTVAKLFKKEELQHKSIVIKMFKTKSKKQLEEEKKAKEAEKIKETAEKEKAKVEFENQKEQEKIEDKEKESKETKTEESKKEDQDKPKESNTAEGRSSSEKPADHGKAKSDSVDKKDKE